MAKTRTGNTVAVSAHRWRRAPSNADVHMSKCAAARGYGQAQVDDGRGKGAPAVTEDGDGEGATEQMRRCADSAPADETGAGGP